MNLWSQMMPRYGFDQRNSSLYLVVCWLCLTVSTFLAVTSLSSAYRLDWMAEGIMPTLSFAMTTALCLAVMALMPKLGHFRSAGSGVVLLAFGIAYWTSGGPERLAGLLCAAGGLSILIPLVLGKRSDEQSPDRTIKIRLPWT